MPDCPICGKGYPTIPLMHDHMLEEHSGYGMPQSSEEPKVTDEGAQTDDIASKFNQAKEPDAI